MVLFEGASNLPAACHSWGFAAVQGHGRKNSKVLKSNVFMVTIARVIISQKQKIDQSPIIQTGS